MTIVEQVLPTAGTCVTVEKYKEDAMRLPTLANDVNAKRKAVASLGGISGRSADIADGTVTRR